MVMFNCYVKLPDGIKIENQKYSEFETRGFFHGDSGIHQLFEKSHQLFQTLVTLWLCQT